MSDYQDAMKDIRQTTQYQEKMNLEREKMLLRLQWKIADFK